MTSFNGGHVEKLEQWIDKMEEDLPPLKNFILPVRSGIVLPFIWISPLPFLPLLLTRSQVARAVLRCMLQEPFAGGRKEGMQLFPPNLRSIQLLLPFTGWFHCTGMGMWIMKQLNTSTGSGSKKHQRDIPSRVLFPTG